MIEPYSEWVGSPNYHSGRNGRSILAIVDHITAGYYPGCLEWMQNPVSQGSAQYLILRDGRILQLVREGDEAWHAGVVNRPDWSLYDGSNPNYYTLGIEHEGMPGDALTEAQYQSSLALHKYLIAKYEIPIDTDHIIGHYRIDSVNRPNCPGSGFPWTRLFADLKGENDVKLNYLVLYYGDADLQIAADLAQNYGCPLVQAAYATPDLLASATTKYQVGGSTAPEGVTLLAGADRFETMKSVLHAMGMV